MSDAEIYGLLRRMVPQGSSDLYLTVGVPPTYRGNDGLRRSGDTALVQEDIEGMLATLADDGQRAEFERHGELNFALDLAEEGRFRVNVFRQRHRPGMVIRRIDAQVPTLESLGLSPLLGELACTKRGLVLIVGGTGSGKSTTLAAMIEARNRAEPGHIVTVEDPIEFIHDHQQSIITQREVGADTESYQTALKNALRQKPDAILIGEIRDQYVMEQAITIAETGHLCLATLHANNAYQALERVLNFFEKARRPQVLLNLSLNLRAIVAQRLVANLREERSMVMEILLNQGLIQELILNGETEKVKEVMARNRALGMQTFDQALTDLCVSGEIAEETAVAEADVASEVRLAIQQSKLGDGTEASPLSRMNTSGLSLSDDG